MHNNNTTLRSSIIMRLRARRMHSTRNIYICILASMHTRNVKRKKIRARTSVITASVTTFISFYFQSTIHTFFNYLL